MEDFRRGKVNNFFGFSQAHLQGKETCAYSSRKLRLFYGLVAESKYVFGNSKMFFRLDTFFKSRISFLLPGGLGDTQRKVQVLGDLTSAEAFAYVCGGKVLNRSGGVEEWPGLIAQSEETLALGMTPDEWKKVWSVCGGNIYLLQNCVADASQYKSWEQGKKSAPGLLNSLLLPINPGILLLACSRETNIVRASEGRRNCFETSKKNPSANWQLWPSSLGIKTL